MIRKSARNLLSVLLGLAFLSPASVFSAPRVLETIQLSQDNTMNQPVPVTYNPADGAIFVGGYYSGNVLKVDASTKRVLARAEGMKYPTNIIVAGGKVYVSALDSNFQAQIFVYDLSLNLLRQIPSANGWIHAFAIDSASSLLYYGTWGRLYAVSLLDDSQRVLHDLNNWIESISDIDIDAPRNRLYLTIYNSDSSLARVLNFDLYGETVAATIPIGKNPVGVDNRYDADRDGDRLFITQMYSSSITVVDVANNSVLQDVPNVSWPQRLIADPSRHKVYIVDNYTDKLHVLDSQTLQIVKSLTPGDDPSGVTFDPTRNRIYTANVWSQDIGVVNYQTYDYIERILFAPATPLDVEVDSSRGLFYVTNGPNGGFYKLDSNQHRLLEKINLYDYMLMAGLYNYPAGLLNLYSGEMELPAASGSDDQMGYAIDEFNHGIAIYNLTTRRNTGSIRPDGPPSSLTLYNGKVYFPYISNSNLYLGVYDGSAISNTLLGPSDGAMGIQINPATGKCYIADYANHKVIVFDLAQNLVLARIAVGNYPAHIAINAADNLIYVTNYGSNSVSVIDGATDLVKTAVTVGDSPWGIRVNAAKKRIYVVNSGAHSLTIIDGRTHAVVSALQVGAGAKFCAVDPSRGKIFVPGQDGGTVTVLEDKADILPPSFDCPASIVKENVETETVAVQYALPAVTDDLDPNPTLSMTPASGSSFSAGVTTVTVTATDASGNTATCKFTVTVKRKICPRPVGDLTAQPLPSKKIKLTWSLSSTPDILAYRIYKGVDDINFSQPVASVSPQSTEWTSEGLTAGVTYKFVVRAQHKSGCEEQNFNTVTATAYDTPPCLSASVTSPSNGRRVSGERLTVTAETRCDDSRDVKAVRFEYKRVSENAWHLIPAANREHENPDDRRPYFVHWDVSGLSNGEYQVRSVAIGDGGSEDSSPSYVTIVVDHSDPDCDEREDEHGRVEKIERVENHKSNRVVVSDQECERPAEVNIPAGALAGDETKVSVKLNPSTPKGQENMKAAGTSIEIELQSGQCALGGEATLVLPYKDDDDDGIVDGTGIRAKDLALFYYNPSRRKWEKMAFNSVDRRNKTVTSRTPHFSLFALFDSLSAADAAFKMGEAYSYPNPARAGKNPVLHAEVGVADEVTFRIYDLSGELVHTVQMAGSPSLVNDKFAYEAQWDVSNVASGVYVVALTAKKENETLRKNFKVGIVK